MTINWKTAFSSKPRSEWKTQEEINKLPAKQPTGGTSETWKRYCEKVAQS